MAEVGRAALTFTPRAWAPPSWPQGPGCRPETRPLGALPGSTVPPPHLSSTVPRGASPLEEVGVTVELSARLLSTFNLRKHFTDVISLH